MSESESDRVKKALVELAENGRLACRKALELAERLGVEPREVGDVANELGIKVVGCQLGCF